ncbi:Uncharacterised protein [Bordetella pertussis]|nr:Uncharacterised protein [Bordetella pertussis]
MLTLALVWRETRPLMTNVSPSPSSTMVSALRVRNAGITVMRLLLSMLEMPLA